MLPLIARIDPELARTWYATYRESLGIERLGFRMFREWPAADARGADIDSGPIVLGAGVTATGAGLAAARATGDTRTAADIDVLAEMLGLPWQTGEGRTYLGGDYEVAELFLAWGRSIPLPDGAPAAPSAAAGIVVRWPFHLACAAIVAGIAWVLVRRRRGRRAGVLAT